MTKDQVIQIRLTQYEKDILKIIADKVKMSVAGYIREVAINRAKTSIYTQTDPWFIEHRREADTDEYKEKIDKALNTDPYILFDGKSAEQLKAEMDQHRLEVDNTIKEAEKLLEYFKQEKEKLENQAKGETKTE